MSRSRLDPPRESRPVVARLRSSRRAGAVSRGVRATRGVRYSVISSIMSYFFIDIYLSALSRYRRGGLGGGRGRVVSLPGAAHVSCGHADCVHDGSHGTSRHTHMIQSVTIVNRIDHGRRQSYA